MNQAAICRRHDESSSLRHTTAFSVGLHASLIHRKIELSTPSSPILHPRRIVASCENRNNIRHHSLENIANLATTVKQNQLQRSSATWERRIASAALGITLLLTAPPLLVLPQASYATTMPNGHPQTATASNTAAVLTAGTTSSLSGSTKSAPLEETNSNGPPEAVEMRAGVLDEVWRLVAKYYFDKTYNGNDWNAIREKFESQDKPASNSGESSMSLAKSMVSTLGDKYSRMLDVESYERIQKYDLIGVGATLIGNDSKQIVVGGPPIHGSAADKAGLQAGDFIMSVNGVPTEGRNSFDIIDQVNENIPQQKIITFSVAKGGDMSNIVEMELERSFVEVSNPVSYKLNVRGDKQGQGKIGYIRIREFNSLANTKLREALVDLESQGATAYVLDLRSNPGGAFQSAVDLASLFIENKVATYFVDSNDLKTPFTTSAKNVVVDNLHPVVIWLDKGSASASEVFAGALHDNCRAVVMGDRSFGKGLIQSVFGLENGSGLVLTVAQYVTPNGSVIQGFGIKPDIQVSLPARIPGLSSISFASGDDTSVVNFEEVSELQTKICSASTSTTVSKSDG